jgi:hypothetical protein
MKRIRYWPVKSPKVSNIDRQTDIGCGILVRSPPCHRQLSVTESR